MILRSVIFCLLSISSTCLAGDWTRISSDTISISGPINKDEYQKFQAIYKTTDKNLIVNSVGGSVEAGVNIGKVIFESKMNVIVRGVCGSSCANYLFTAGNRKIIENGIVGFHGNWKAWVGTYDFLEEIINRTALDDRYDKVNHIDQVVKEETQLLEKIGVSQDLFNKTQKESDEGKYSLYLPTAKTFEKYGIKNVEGVQSIEMIKSYPAGTLMLD